MAAPERVVILKSWSTRDDVSVIKEVATKGEYVDLCMAYLARKKHIPIEESRKYFHQIVDNYIHRLLNDKLVFKAEDVLCNVSRDWKSVYYQFAFDTKIHTIKDLILNHVMKKDPEKFNEELIDYEFNWKLLKEIQKHSTLSNEIQNEMEAFTLEALYQKDENYRKTLIVRLYFETGDIELINKIDKVVLWNYLITRKLYTELTKWSYLSQQDKEGESNQRNLKDYLISNNSTLIDFYFRHNIENEMYKTASDRLQDVPEMLRNFFITKGHVFTDERKDTCKILQRLFTTQSFNKINTNFEIYLNRTSLVKFILENDAFSILIDENFYSSEILEQIKIEFPNRVKEIDFLMQLNNETMQDRDSFVRLLDMIEFYLKSVNGFNQNTLKDDTKGDTEDDYDQNINKYTLPMVTFLRYILNEENLNNINSSNYESIQKLPYIQSLRQRIKNFTPSMNKFNAIEIFKSIKHIDLNEINKESGNEPIAFSNSELGRKYAQNFKLNYLHYLRQLRSSYGVYYFFIRQLIDYSQITKSQLHSAAEIIIELAITNFNRNEFLVHCIAFIEMMGFNSQNLRSYLQLLKISYPFIQKQQQRQPNLNNSNEKSFSFSNYYELIEIAEKEIFKNYLNDATNTNVNNDEENTTKEFPLRQYNTIMRISQTFPNKLWPNYYLNKLCESNEWWKYLILIQYLDIPLSQIKKNFKSFKTITISEHILRAIFYEPAQEKSKRRSSISRQKTKPKSDNMHTSGETMTTSSISSSSEVNSLFKSVTQVKFLQENDDLDIFAIILLSANNLPSSTEDKIESYAKFVEIIFDNNNSYSTSINLLKNCIKYNQSILATLSAVINDSNLKYNWLVWLSTLTTGINIIQKYNDFDEIFWNLIETSVRMSCIETLHRSFQLFFKENKFNYLTSFLQKSYNLKFTDDVIDDLRYFLLAWSNDEIYLPINEYNKDYLLFFTIKLLLIHLKFNFESTNYQQQLIDIICRSGISDISFNYFDFCLFRKIFKIISTSKINFDYEKLIIESKYERQQNDENEFENLLILLQESKQYDKAIELYNVLNTPVSDLVYSKWINEIDKYWPNRFDFNEYERETQEYSLAPEILINFYLHVSSLYIEPCIQKYLMMKKALDVIKANHLFPNESFDRDNIEYEMILCYLQNDQNINDLDIYHSEYFEQILSIERCVLYKSFPELKELAGIEDLTTTSKVQLNDSMKLKLANLLNRLLDEGDIVEALRLQAMFEYRTLDLHFIVFCMALAENLTSLYNLSPDERQLLTAVEMTSITKFSKRTLGRVKTSAALPQSQVNQNETSDSWSTLDFEEIPPREKQDILEAIQGLASRLKHGINIGKRIVMVYRAAMYLDKDYLDVLRMKDSTILLKSATEDDCLQKLLVVSDIITSTQMSQTEIAEFLSYEIVTAIIRPRFYIFRSDQSNNPAANLHFPIKNCIWGYDLDKEFHLFLELCPNTTLLGNYLLDYCDALKIYRKYQDNKNFDKDINENPRILQIFQNLKEIIQIYGLPFNHNQNYPQLTSQVLSHKKQNIIYVELLIKAHECFVHECSMEGIANILNRSRSLNSILCTAKSWNLIVRMLIGVGRYREMYFCFDTLIKNDQFESLLGQFDEDKTNGLRHAIIWYIREYCPQNKEYLKLAALHFLMFKELAELWEEETNSLIAKILSKNQKHDEINNERINENRFGGTTSTPIKISMLSCSTEVLNQLNEVLNNCIHATENYLLDNKLRLAKRSASNAELIALQIDLMNKALASTSLNQNCVCILNIRSWDEFKEIINKELSVPQAMILDRAYSYDINWPEAILNQYIIMGRNSYIIEFSERMNLTDNIIENVVKNFQLLTSVKPSVEENMVNLVKMVKSVGLRYKLASLLGFKGILTSLINDQSSYYLKDINYGRSNILPGG